MSSKKYVKGDITVLWNADKCIHAANCVNGLPNVFKPKEKPWIQVEGATAEAIVAQVKECPSGALSIEGNEDSNGIESAKAQVFANGPVIVTGPLEITHTDGTKTTMERAAFCRCGASEKKPFCDGTHKKIDFTG